MRLLLFAFALFTLSLALATPADSDYRASLHPGSSRITTTTTTTKWSYEICGDPTDPIQIDHIHVTPDPPQAGKDLTIILVGNATELLKDGAYADVVVRIGAIKLLQREYDLCEEAYVAPLFVIIINFTAQMSFSVYNYLLFFCSSQAQSSIKPTMPGPARLLQHHTYNRTPPNNSEVYVSYPPAPPPRITV
ncbi:hypothetical protein D9615_003350 [Tricholomella constricta]|uniref:MD-2-related lipid-recognition domain-containing protein n=1 Tax=Tricholomella constricta TaxID=117010 RepID=A0A8H5HJ89_9AGAR|nr:hypothetical protein D9615_003350 [Tricholomella constricta]